MCPLPFSFVFTKGYCFDDVLLIPKLSDIESRDLIDTGVDLPNGIHLDIPLISANMATVTEVEMCHAVTSKGGLAILHRFYDYDLIVNIYREASYPNQNGAVGASVGIKPKDEQLAIDLYNAGCRVICVDVAHGHHTAVAAFIRKLRQICPNPDLCIIAGNVVTDEGAILLWEAGADIIKIGVGSGSICSTRIETGNGYPQLSALNNVCNSYYEPREDRGEDSYPMFIADGGIRTAGDCVKSLCFADLVMIGNLFAGTDEAPGNIISLDGQKYKQYVGSSTHKQRHIEGVVGMVPYRGKVGNVINHLCQGIRSGMSYQGARNLRELKQKPDFVVISNAGIIESRPHDIKL